MSDAALYCVTVAPIVYIAALAIRIDRGRWGA